MNTIDALRKNALARESELFVFSDAAPTPAQEQPVNSVRAFLKNTDGFKKINVIERERNYGLGNNIIEGVTEIVNRWGKIIVLEDDLITAPHFLEYMNQGLDIYSNDARVSSIQGYVYPVKTPLPETFFIKGADCLGWATWKRAWDLFEKDGRVLLQKLVETNQTAVFDFEGAYPYTQMLKDQVAGKNNSWAVRWYAAAFLADLYTLYPGKSLVFHAGGDGSGTNTGYDRLLDTELSKDPVRVSRIAVQQDQRARAAFSEFLHRLYKPPLTYRVARTIRTLIRKVLAARGRKVRNRH